MTSCHARLASSFRKPKQTQLQSGCIKPSLQSQCSATTAEETDSSDNVSGHRHLLFISHTPYSHFFYKHMVSFIMQWATAPRAWREQPGNSVRSKFSMQCWWDGLVWGVCTPLTISRLVTCACAGELYWLCSVAWRTVNRTRVCTNELEFPLLCWGVSHCQSQSNHIRSVKKKTTSLNYVLVNYKVILSISS